MLRRLIGCHDRGDQAIEIPPTSAIQRRRETHSAVRDGVARQAKAFHGGPAIRRPRHRQRRLNRRLPPRQPRPLRRAQRGFLGNHPISGRRRHLRSLAFGFRQMEQLILKRPLIRTPHRKKNRQNNPPRGAIRDRFCLPVSMHPSDRAQHEPFLRLFMEQEAALRVFVRSLLFSQEEAREVMQEVSLVLWRKFDPAMAADAFGRWAFGVARLEVLAFRRDRARDRLSFAPELVELLGQTVEDLADDLAAERRALEICLQKLPVGPRELVQAAYAPGVKLDRLAQHLGRSPMAVYKTLHRIRLSLMECTRRVLNLEETA